MWTGEIREWSFSDRVIQGQLTGRIYKSNLCRWANWEYPDGSFIRIQVYHYPDPNRLKYVTYLKPDGSDLLEETVNNYMRLTVGSFDGKTNWYWDVKQTGSWNPCPLHFKLLVTEEIVPSIDKFNWNDTATHRWWKYRYSEKEKDKFPFKSKDIDFTKIGIQVSEYPIGYKQPWHHGIDYRDLVVPWKYRDNPFTYYIEEYYREKKEMTIIEDDPENEAEVIPHPKLSIISGGKDNTSNWLLSLAEGSVFLCRHKKDEKDFILIQFHVRKKWGMAVWLHSNFPMQQQGDYFVHSLKFSQQHELVDLLQDGETDELRGEVE